MMGSAVEKEEAAGMMGTVVAEVAQENLCASCGIAQVDDIKLKECNGGCNLVKYCSDACQELHRPEHAGVCRKRKGALHDKKLFKQPTSLGENVLSASCRC